MNATQRGNANRLKTKKWYEKQGYDCAVVEQAKFWNFRGRRFVSKKDAFSWKIRAREPKIIEVI